MYASVYERIKPFTDGKSATEYVIELASGGWLDYSSKATWTINMARGFPERGSAIGVAEREGYIVVNK